MDDKEFEALLAQQRRLQSKVLQEQQLESELDVLAIISEMAPYPDQRLQKEAVIVEAMHRGLDHEFADSIIQKLIKDRILFEPVPGYIQRR